MNSGIWKIWRPGLVDIVGILLLSGLVFFSPSFADDPGIGWHLRSGEWIEASHTVPVEDPFLATSEGKSWIATQWLADLIFWKVYHAGGWALLQIFSIALLVATYGMLVVAAEREGLRGMERAVAVLFAALCGTIQWFTRPVLFSFLLFAFVYVIALRWCSREPIDHPRSFRLAVWLLPVLFAVWANLHPGFPMGLILLAGATLACFVKRRWSSGALLAAITFLSALATLATPYGIALHESIFSLLDSNFFMSLNIEWFSPRISTPLLWPFYATVVLLVLFGGRNWTVLDWILTLGFLLLAFGSQRYVPFFGLVVALPLARMFTAWRRGDAALAEALAGIAARDGAATAGRYTVGLLCCYVVLVAITGRLPLRTSEDAMPGEGYPWRAVGLLRQSEERGQIFNGPDWGGFLTFYLWPEHGRRVFIDDRNELNGSELYRDYFTIALAREGWRDLLQRYNFSWMLLRGDEPLALLLESHSDWTAVPGAEPYQLYRRAQSREAG